MNLSYLERDIPGSTLIYRRVASPVLWNFGYQLIILGEGMTLLPSGPRPWLYFVSCDLTGHGSTVRSALCSSARRLGFWSGFLVRGGRRRMVSDVAVADLAWSGERFSLL